MSYCDSAAWLWLPCLASICRLRAAMLKPTSRKTRIADVTAMLCSLGAALALKKINFQKR